MKMFITQNKGSVPITFIRLEGKLDGSNYMDLVNEAERLWETGTKDLLLDLSTLTYMSSAGLIALHTIASVFRGQKRIIDEEGWSAYRAIGRERGTGPQVHVKLFGITGNVHSVLDMAGYSTFFEIYTDLPTAVASFYKPMPVRKTSSLATNL